MNTNVRAWKMKYNMVRIRFFISIKTFSLAYGEHEHRNVYSNGSIKISIGKNVGIIRFQDQI